MTDERMKGMIYCEVAAIDAHALTQGLTQIIVQMHSKLDLFGIDRLIR